MGWFDSVKFVKCQMEVSTWGWRVGDLLSQKRIKIKKNIP